MAARARRGRARSPTASRAPTCSAPRYEPPFPFIPAEEYGDEGPHRAARRLRHRRGRHRHRPHRDRVRRGRLPARRTSRGSTSINPVRLDGTYDERIGPYAGRWVKDADADLIEDLRARGRLLRAERYLHAYPHCWRCGTPLLYYAKPSWYIRTSQLRDRLLAANETVDWHPRAHQARALRPLAGEQRRLGDLARALLGHAAAGLALRERPRRVHRLVRRAGASARARRSRTRTGPTSTTPTWAVRASAASRCGACPR